MPAKQRDWTRVEQSKHYGVLRDFLANSTSSSSIDQSTLQEAVQAFTEPTVSAYKAQTSRSTDGGDPVEGTLWDAWESVVRTVSLTSTTIAQLKQLVDFMSTVQSLPPLKDPKTDETCVVWGMTVWSDLPVFGANTREALDQPEALESPYNFAAFYALLTTRAYTSDPPIKSLDSRLHGLWMLRDALESRNPSNSERADLVAAAWMTHAGEVLWRLSRDGVDMKMRYGREGDKEELDGKDWKGFNVERWRFWRKGFEEKLKEDLDEERKRKIEEALEVMSRAETGTER